MPKDPGFIPNPWLRNRNFVSIISSALDIDKDGTRKSKSRPSMARKQPPPFGVSERSAYGNICNDF